MSPLSSFENRSFIEWFFSVFRGVCLSFCGTAGEMQGIAVT